MDGTDWDEWYRQPERVWSGRPNAALLHEVQGLEPGTVLDVGCGEGADAIWLAKRGWTVTGLDVSAIALERAARTADEESAEVTWVHCPMSDFTPPPGGFNLVCALYPALPSESVPTLLACVRQGGTLLVVGHAHLDPEQLHAHGHGIPPFVGVSEIAEQLGRGWVIEVDVERARIDPPPGAEHVLDEVLRARRVD